MRPGSCAGLLWLVVLLLSPCGAHAGASARQNYNTYCVQCHGMQGNGRGVNTGDMAVQPRNHTDARGMAIRSDARLFRAIKYGGLSVDKSVLMPPWGDTFSDGEIRGLVRYLRKLCRCRYDEKGR